MKRYTVMYDCNSVFSTDDFEEAKRFYVEDVLKRYHRPQSGVIDNTIIGYGWVL